MKKLILLLLLIILVSMISSVFASNLEDSIVILKSDNFNDTKETIRNIKDSGGEVYAVFIPNVLITKLPNNKNKIMEDKNIQKISNNQIDLNELGNSDKSKEIGIKVWNKKFEPNQMQVNGSSKGNNSPSPILNDALAVPEELNQRLDKMDKNNLVSQAKPLNAPPFSGTSDYLYGDVLASIIFLESDGNIDSSTEDWTSTEETNVIDEINNGLYWWVNIKPSNVDLTIYYIVDYAVPTSYEPINRPSYTAYPDGQALWIDEAMDFLGSSGSDFFNKVDNYDGSLRNIYGMDWVFTIFVIDSSNDTDGMFTDGKFAYAYLNGPFMVMTYDNELWGINNMDSVTAHEFGHIFGAADQYSGAWSCDSISDCSATFGYLNVQNQNCVMSCGSNIDSIMRSTLSSYQNNAIDYYAKGQVGWRDLDGDNITDVIDSSYNYWDDDNDNDSIINYWDSDDDNDGILDTSDNCQFTVGITYYNGCPDTYPPIFGDWIFTTPAKTYNNHPLSVNIIDPSGINSTILHYDYADDGIEDGTIVMTNAGDIYSATIPSTGKNYRDNNIAFYITAIDNINSIGNSSKQLIFIENTLPTIDLFNPLTSQTINELDTINFTHTSSDLDGDSLTYEWLLDSVPNATTQNWSYITDYSSAGAHTITLKVSDGISTTSQNWTITVNNINQPPIWNPEPENQTIQEDTNLSYQISATDNDGETLNYSIDDLNFSIDSNGLITWLPSINWFGTKTIVISATDGIGMINKEIFITVTPVNDAPTLTANNYVVDENQSLTFIITANDPDGDSLMYSATNLPTGASFNPATQTFEWTPTYDQSSIYTIDFAATDGILTDTKQFILTVNNVNRAPTLVNNIIDQTFDEDTNITIDLSPYFSDLDGDSLTYSIILNPANIDTQLNGNTVSLNPNINWNGINTIRVRATDGSLSVDSNIINLNVNPVNDAPVLTITTPNNNQIFTQGDSITFTGTANDIEDGDLSNNIQWDSNVDGNIGIFSTQIINTLSLGKHTITANVIDSNLIESYTNIVVYVNRLGNTAPIANAGSDKSVNTGSVVTLEGSLSSDLESDSLTYLWTQVSGPTVILSDNTAINPTFTSNADGTYEFSLIVNDGILDSSVDTIVITSTTPAPTASGGSGGGGSSGGGGGGSDICGNIGKLTEKTIDTRTGCIIKFKIGDIDYSFSILSATKNSLTITINGAVYTMKLGEKFTVPLSNTQNKDVEFTFSNFDFGDISLSLEAVEQKPTQGESETENKKESSISNSQSSSGSSEPETKTSSGMSGITGSVVKDNNANNAVVEKVKEVANSIKETIVTIGQNIKEFVKEILNLK